MQRLAHFWNRLDCTCGMLRLVSLLALVCVTTSIQAQTELRIANLGEPASLDPHYVSGVWENRIIGDLFLGLTTEGPDGKPVAGAADEWTVSDDGTVYTFHIRDHVWSDGTPVTAGDFEYAFRRILRPETAAEYASLLYPIKNAEALNTAQMTDMDQLGVKALDERTLVITLEASTPYFLAQLTHHTAFPVPRHRVEQYGNDWTKPANIASNGAYVLDEWLPSTHTVLLKNPKFYAADTVAIDRVVFYPGEDRAAVQKRFRAGEIDIAMDFASDQIEWLRNNLSEQTRIAPYLGVYYYPVNTAKPPFDDVRVRQALSMAINREALTDKVLKTGEVPAYSLVPPGTNNYGEPAYVSWMGVPYEARLAQARSLLAEAGFGPDNPLEFTLSYNTSENHKRIAIAVASMWKQLGARVELFNTEVKVHYDKLKQGDFDVARAGWIADYNDPQNFLYLLQSSSGPLNYGRYANPEYDALMEQASATTDLTKRAGLMAQAESLAMRDQPVIPIYYYVSKNLVSNAVQGWQDTINDIHRSRYLSLK